MALLAVAWLAGCVAGCARAGQSAFDSGMVDPTDLTCIRFREGMVGCYDPEAQAYSIVIGAIGRGTLAVCDVAHHDIFCCAFEPNTKKRLALIDEDGYRIWKTSAFADGTYVGSEPENGCRMWLQIEELGLTVAVIDWTKGHGDTLTLSGIVLGGPAAQMKQFGSISEFRKAAYGLRPRSR